MRKVMLILSSLALIVLFLASPVLAQWGAIQSGADALKRAKEGEKKAEPAKKEDPNAPMNLAQDDKKPTFTAPTTLKNNARKFSFTIPAGWQQAGGDVQDERGASFGKPGTTMSFSFHCTQMAPSFPAKSAVETGLKSAKEEITIGKLISTKRRDDPSGPTPIVIGWEIVQTRKGGSGSHQSIIWQCYDKQNYYYNFNVTSHPDQFNANRAEMEKVINSVHFGR
ncbi:MAG: hypothetical protein NTW80_11525 [Deltaproteobacteria bacterium]|nr:hypothetical protein [Deltaproteobacteria bacterium]